MGSMVSSSRWIVIFARFQPKLLSVKVCARVVIEILRRQTLERAVDSFVREFTDSVSKCVRLNVLREVCAKSNKTNWGYRIANFETTVITGSSERRRTCQVPLHENRTFYKACEFDR